MKVLQILVVAAFSLGLSASAYAHCGGCGTGEKHDKPAATKCMKKCAKAKDAKACKAACKKAAKKHTHKKK